MIKLEDCKKVIEYRIMNDGPIETCQELCNELMVLQAERAVKYKDILAAMNFSNRLKPSFEAAPERFLLVAFDGGKAVGYVFSSTEVVTDEVYEQRPDWTSAFTKDSHWIYPDDLARPYKIGELVNLYIKQEYRGLHIGGYFMNEAMAWLHSRERLDRLMVYVSNGNNPGSLYEKYGFHRSFDVLDGMITAYSQKP